LKNKVLNKISNNNILIAVILIIFFFIQCYFIFKGGVTYDEKEYKVGSQILSQKIFFILNGDFTNPSLKTFTTIEYFGLIFIYPAYFLSNYFSENNEEIIIRFFDSQDSYYYLLTHYFLNILVCILLVISYKLIKRIKDINFSILFIFFLIMVPSFSGHAQFNSKDIPYLFLLLIYKLYFLNLTPFKNRDILKIGTVLAVAASVRLSAYLFLTFFLFFYIFYFHFFQPMSLKKITFFQIFSIYTCSFLGLYIFTPQSWVHPIKYFKETFYHQFFHPWDGNTLTNGKYIIAQKISSTYLINWYTVKLPLIFIISFTIMLFFIKKNMQDFLFLYSYSLIFSVFILVSIFKPTAYDGIRHFLFLIPFFVYIFVFFIFFISKQYNLKVLNILFVSIIYLFISQYGLSNMRYVYFNELVNIDRAAYYCQESIDGCGNWVTDYWGYSGKQIGNSLSKLIETNSTVLICKPFHSFDSYIKSQEYNLTRSTNAFKNFYTVTFHRPRLNQDSCSFYLENIEPNCILIKEYKARIRNKYLTTGYLNYCSLKN